MLSEHDKQPPIKHNAIKLKYIRNTTFNTDKNSEGLTNKLAIHNGNKP